MWLIKEYGPGVYTIIRTRVDFFGTWFGKEERFPFLSFFSVLIYMLEQLEIMFNTINYNYPIQALNYYASLSHLEI